MRLVVTDEFVIVSNSNGKLPTISFFDHDLKLIESFPRVSVNEAPYNLNVYTVPALEML